MMMNRHDPMVAPTWSATFCPSVNLFSGLAAPSERDPPAGFARPGSSPDSR